MQGLIHPACLSWTTSCCFEPVNLPSACQSKCCDQCLGQCLLESCHAMPGHAFIFLTAGLLRYIGVMLMLPCLQVIVNQILLGLIAALGCLVGGTLLLPSLATDELREVLADIIQKCGYSISGYASRVFPPEQVSGACTTHSAFPRRCSSSFALFMCKPLCSPMPSR